MFPNIQAQATTLNIAYFQFLNLARTWHVFRSPKLCSKMAHRHWVMLCCSHEASLFLWTQAWPLLTCSGALISCHLQSKLVYLRIFSLVNLLILASVFAILCVSKTFGQVVLKLNRMRSKHTRPLLPQRLSSTGMTPEPYPGLSILCFSWGWGCLRLGDLFIPSYRSLSEQRCLLALCIVTCGESRGWYKK